MKGRKAVLIGGVDGCLALPDQEADGVQVPRQDGPVQDGLPGPVRVIDVYVGLLHEVAEAVQVARPRGIVGGRGPVFGPRDLLDHFVLHEVDEDADLALPGCHVHGRDAVLVRDQLAQGL